MEYVKTYYAATAPINPSRPSLSGRIRADVCVIGGGFTGLSAAIHLAERGASVVLLDAKRVGWGASGRNAGQVLNGLHADIESYVKRTSPSHRKVFEEALFEGPQIIDRISKTYQIDTDYRPISILAALTNSHLAYLAEKATEWRKHGHTGVELVSGVDVGKFIRNEHRYRGLLIDRWGGHFNPLKMALGEARALEALGGLIFENSKVVRIDTNQTSVVFTENGQVEARHVVMAGNAYITDLAPRLDRRSMVVGSQIVTTEVLPETVAKSLLPGGGCVEEMVLDANFYRLTADNRMSFGAGVNIGDQSEQQILKRVVPRMISLFPQMRSSRIEYAWSCNFLVTLNGLPQMGSTGTNTFYSQGCNGFGVSSSHLAGKILAEAITGSPNRFAAFSSISHYPIPGRSAFRVPYIMGGAYAYRWRDWISARLRP